MPRSLSNSLQALQMIVQEHVLPAACILFLCLTMLDVISISSLKSSRSLDLERIFKNEFSVPHIDHPGLGLQFDNDHYNISSHSAWGSLVPPNKGITFEGQIALYQQLECINHIRISTLQLYNISTTGTAPRPDYKRTDVCFGVLRQALLCATDITLETPGPPTRHPDGTIEMGIITGLGVTHRCKNYDSVNNYIWSM